MRKIMPVEEVIKIATLPEIETEKLVEYYEDLFAYDIEEYSRLRFNRFLMSVVYHKDTDSWYYPLLILGETAVELSKKYVISKDVQAEASKIINEKLEKSGYSISLILSSESRGLIEW